jgi:hypothetical protein
MFTINTCLQYLQTWILSLCVRNIANFGVVGAQLEHSPANTTYSRVHNVRSEILEVYYQGHKTKKLQFLASSKLQYARHTQGAKNKQLLQHGSRFAGLPTTLYYSVGTFTRCWHKKQVPIGNCTLLQMLHYCAYLPH